MTEVEFKTTDESILLKDKQMEAIISWIGERWVDHRCTICQQNDWQVEKYMVAGNLINIGSVQVGSSIAYPFVMVCCQNCGHVHLFNATKIKGVFDEIEVADGTD